MAIFILHFDCAPDQHGPRGKAITAEACVIADTMEEAEAIARTAIRERRHQAGALIAYTTVDRSRIGELDGYETVLYLKAMQNTPAVAVIFS